MLSFLVFTDLHYDEVADGDKRIEEILANARKRDLDFIVSLGDLCNPVDENLKVLKQFKSLGIPFDNLSQIYFEAKKLQDGFLFCLKKCMIIHKLSEILGMGGVGMIIGFIIWSLCAVLFFVIGVVDLKSKKPVGFFTGVKPPKITDVKNYNKAVAMLWFVTGIVFELIGVPFLYLKQNSPAFVFVMLATVVLVIVMMVVYLSISRKYEEK